MFSDQHTSPPIDWWGITGYKNPLEKKISGFEKRGNHSTSADV